MEKVLETSAYKWTKASIHAFGSTVLEEGKRPFTGITKEIVPMKIVFSQKKRLDWKYIYLFFSCLKVLVSFTIFSGFLEAEGSWGNIFRLSVCS